MKFCLTLFVIIFAITFLDAQYTPSNITSKEKLEAQNWVQNTYKSLTLEEKIGQLFIVALYTNKDNQHIDQVRNLVINEKIGGIILMQDDAAKEIQLVNEFQEKSKIPLMIGMDAEWGVFQRIASAHKFPWAITLGAIQDKQLIYEMAQKIAEDCKRMGINWDFAPVVDVNTNPENPIIGNRSFGSDVNNVIASGLAYSRGLQDSGILAAIKHFPGHGDTDTDSHLDLPVVSHPLKRLNEIELAPFKALVDKGIGGIMVAHLYVPALEDQKGIPASLSKKIVTDLLKKKLNYKGLVITDALNMGAVANKYKPGEVDALAFEAGNDLLLFSQGVKEGKALIKNAIETKKLSECRLEESVKKILLTKYYLGLSKYTPKNPSNIDSDLNNKSHETLMQKLYANALTVIRDQKKLLPLQKNETYYYLPLEEAPHQFFHDELTKYTKTKRITPEEIATIPAHSTIIIGLHKDNTTAYKPYKISEKSKQIIYQLAKNYNIILDVFGSPYALKDMEISDISTIVISYENNQDSMIATANALLGNSKISGKLPVTVNANLPSGLGLNVEANPK